MVSGTAPIGSAFNESDKVLAQSVKTVVDLILLPAIINLDFADVKKTLHESGVSLIGFGLGTGPNRSKDAANSAINSPLLEASISGARKAIVSVTCGPEVTLYEAKSTVDRLIEASGHDIDIKFGVAINDQLTDEILVSVIASDFEQSIDFSTPTTYTPKIEEPKKEENTLFSGADLFSVKEETKENKSTLDEDVSSDNILPSFFND
jgi:cell division protein FtsZ